MRALQVERRPARFAAARLLAGSSTRRAIESGPLSLVDVDPPELPGPEWVRVRPRLAGICGSDLASVFFETSRYFEPLVSLPFIPGHEVVVDVEGRPGRWVVEPALTCAVRGVPLCDACQRGETQRCASVAVGDLEPGIQTGYCTSTGGGWASEFVAHEATLHAVPDELDDEDAVMVEPLACGLHTVLSVGRRDGHVAVIGAGTVGLVATAVAARLQSFASVTSVARYPLQRELASKLGADQVVTERELPERARRLRGSLRAGRFLGDGFDVVIDAVGSAPSIQLAIESVRPGGEVILAGMPAPQRLDLAPLWHREVRLVGAYAYGTEVLESDVAASLGRTAGPVRTFELAVGLAGDLRLGRLVTHRYGLRDYVTAITRAREGGRADAIKVVFDLHQRKAR